MGSALFCFVYFSRFSSTLVGVAVVKSACALSMLCPRPLTQPAELITALGARHVHAPLIFFDWPSALWTRLRVGQNPRHVFAFSAIFYQPFPHGLTIDGPMCFFLARKAKSIAAHAINIEWLSWGFHQRLCHRSASWCCAPGHVFVVIHETTQGKLAIMT